ncbi:MAG TPA: FHA domain-containing protein [Pyrinomonadaceae bacterium]|nr:FHA domain-containing protein [Pyrinomonadaceae bacterium]
MTEDRPHNSRSTSIDSLVRGVLGKFGDIFDRFTGRQWKPSSGLATSEVIERIKRILDTEARDVRGKGKVVPHSVILKMQWDKFSTDDPKTIGEFENELLVAAIDHINDRRYYTSGPMTVEVKPDYFTEGIKFIASFDPSSGNEEDEREVHLSIPPLNASETARSTNDAGEDMDPASGKEIGAVTICTATFELGGFAHEIKLRVPTPGRVSVGRTAESLLRIDDTSISKHHATLAVSADAQMAVADTGSTNGTKVNGEKLSYGEAVAISAGDAVTFGSVDVKFSLEAETPETEVSEPSDEFLDEEVAAE